MKEQFSSLSSAVLAAVGAAPTWTTAGVFALLGLAGGATASLVKTWLAPVFIGLSVLLLLRSFYILYVKRRGTRAAVVVTWLSAVFVVGYWTWRWL